MQLLVTLTLTRRRLYVNTAAVNANTITKNMQNNTQLHLQTLAAFGAFKREVKRRGLLKTHQLSWK